MVYVAPKGAVPKTRDTLFYVISLLKVDLKGLMV